MKKHVVAAFLALAASSSMAAVITFDPLALNTAGLAAVSNYTEAGFSVSGPLGTIGAQFAGAYAGSASLFLANPGNVATLAKVDGSTFSLNSIDLSALAPSWYGGGATVTFTGNVHGGGTLTQSFTTGTALGFDTYTFSGFDMLDSVSWVQAAPYYQFDNIVVDASAAVPEPGTLALFGVALAGLGALRRKAFKA
ncbi:MAG: PEP-CTERM sorting domain-containing protein [Telluria sp.]